MLHSDFDPVIAEADMVRAGYVALAAAILREQWSKIDGKVSY